MQFKPQLKMYPILYCTNTQVLYIRYLRFRKVKCEKAEREWEVD